MAVLSSLALSSPLFPYLSADFLSTAPFFFLSSDGIFCSRKRVKIRWGLVFGKRMGSKKKKKGASSNLCSWTFANGCKIHLRDVGVTHVSPLQAAPLPLLNSSFYPFLLLSLCLFLTDAGPVFSLEYFLIEAVPSASIRMSGNVSSFYIYIYQDLEKKYWSYLWLYLSLRYLYTSPWGAFLCSDSKHVAPGHLGQVPSGEEKVLCCSCPANCYLSVVW